MKWLDSEKKEKRDKVFTVRITQSCYDKIEDIMTYLNNKHLGSSQADVIEHLINLAHKETIKNNKSRKK